TYRLLVSLRGTTERLDNRLPDLRVGVTRDPEERRGGILGIRADLPQGESRRFTGGGVAVLQRLQMLRDSCGASAARVKAGQRTAAFGEDELKAHNGHNGQDQKDEARD